MTKTTLKRAGLVGKSLLLMATAYGGNTKQAPADAHQKVLIGVTTLLHQGTFTDTSASQMSQPDSTYLHLQEFFESEATAAPKVRLNAKVAPYVKTYLKQNEESLEKIRSRNQNTFKLIETIFRQYNLPTELKYLAVIESKLKTTAVSKVGAVGPWQFMPATARALGLKITSKYDERRHFYKSTVAAAKYLRDLYNQYEDWLLVIAAYNGGPGTVNKAIRYSGSRNFWRLQQFLPAETRHHVKRFIGAHYFFEEEGSLVTLTKQETEAYQKAMDKFIAERNCNWEELRTLIEGMEAEPEAISVAKGK